MVLRGCHRSLFAAGVGVDDRDHALVLLAGAETIRHQDHLTSPIDGW